MGIGVIRVRILVASHSHSHIVLDIPHFSQKWNSIKPPIRNLVENYAEN